MLVISLLNMTLPAGMMQYSLDNCNPLEIRNYIQISMLPVYPYCFP